MIVSDRDAGGVDNETRSATCGVYLQADLRIDEGSLCFNPDHCLTNIFQAGNGAALRSRLGLRLDNQQSSGLLGDSFQFVSLILPYSDQKKAAPV